MVAKITIISQKLPVPHCKDLFSFLKPAVYILSHCYLSGCFIVIPSICSCWIVAMLPSLSFSTDLLLLCSFSVKSNPFHWGLCFHCWDLFVPGSIDFEWSLAKSSHLHTVHTGMSFQSNWLIQHWSFTQLSKGNFHWNVQNFLQLWLISKASFSQLICR